MNTTFDYGGITAFHCGIFAAFYFCAAYAIWVYYRHIRGDVALSLHSVASGLCHVLIFISGLINPPSPNLYLAIACYCCSASPTIMLCLREAIDPGWISWKRYFAYIGLFHIGTVLAGIFAREYIFYILVFADMWFCCYAAYRLIKGINKHEKLIKLHFAETELYSYNWARYFVYFQVVNVIVFLLLYRHLNVTFNILFNYVQAFYWLYFLLMCKKYRYYSRQIPKEVMEEISLNKIEEEDTTLDKIEEIEVEEIEVTQHSAKADKEKKGNYKMQISFEIMEYIDNQIKKFEKEKGYLNKSLTLTSLAQEIGTNRTYLCIYFKKKGTTFCDYINQLRCTYAVHAMGLQPDISMSDLANACGYRNENSFRKSFTAFFGKTPYVYKREMLLNEKEKELAL